MERMKPPVLSKCTVSLAEFTQNSECGLCCVRAAAVSCPPASPDGPGAAICRPFGEDGVGPPASVYVSFLTQAHHLLLRVLREKYEIKKI